MPYSLLSSRKARTSCMLGLLLTAGVDTMNFFVVDIALILHEFSLKQ